MCGERSSGWGCQVKLPMVSRWGHFRFVLMGPGGAEGFKQNLKNE